MPLLFITLISSTAEPGNLTNYFTKIGVDTTINYTAFVIIEPIINFTCKLWDENYFDAGINKLHFIIFFVFV